MSTGVDWCWLMMIDADCWLVLIYSFFRSFSFHNVSLSCFEALPEAQRSQGIESLTWVILLAELNLYPFQISDFDSMALLALITNFATRLYASVAILATRWCHLHHLKIGPPSGTTWIRSKCGHKVAPLALVLKLTIRWRHLQMLQIWPPGCVTCIVTLSWIALLALSV